MSSFHSKDPAIPQSPPDDLDYKIIYSISKKYPTHTKYVVYNQPYSIPIIRAGDPEKLPLSIRKLLSDRPKTSEYQLADRSMRRAKTEIKDIILCNKFDMFATFTFNGDEKNIEKFGYTVHNRQDPNELKVVMAKWLKAQRRKYGRFEYIIVPEFHKDGRSLHFHALFNGYKGNLTDTGHLNNSRVVWNIDNFNHGHSSIVKIRQTAKDIGRVSSYLTKYVTKDMPTFGSKKRYWCSTRFERPEKSLNAPLPSIDLFTKLYETQEYTIYEFPHI